MLGRSQSGAKSMNYYIILCGCRERFHSPRLVAEINMFFDLGTYLYTDDPSTVHFIFNWQYCEERDTSAAARRNQTEAVGEAT